jgi:RNA polymerase sigma-70 factor (ECF subfamily)
MGSSLAVNLDDTALLKEYAHGNREAAINAFVRRHQRFVYSLALRHLHHNHDDAEDAAQEVFIRALRSLESFKGESSLQTWLYRITVNVCHTMRRKNVLRSWFARSDEDTQSIELTDGSPDPEQRLLDAHFHDAFSAMLMTLPDKQRETFCLRYFDELSYEEISQMLGTSIGGLKANYFHAVQKLGQLLQNSEYAPQRRSL